MKIAIYVAALLIVCAPNFKNFAQCKDEPQLEKTSKVLKTETFKLVAPVESSLVVKASAPGASWAKKGAEAAVLSVFVDGKYNQDLILFAGATTFEYHILLGRLEKGAHEIVVILNEARSAANIKQVIVDALSPDVFSLDYVPKQTSARRGSPDATDFENLQKAFAAESNAPFIYARPNAIDKFTDIPLVTYYELFDEPNRVTRIRYTTIFSNEDGGTPAAALMARWGRLTDIEWVYEIELKDNQIISEIYQAANHQTLEFKGRKVFGSHPLIFTTTDNNNFSDAGCSALRSAPAPVQANLTAGSRETMMEKFPWTYRMMAEEASRENRINPTKIDAFSIADPRDYLYAEIYFKPTASAIALAVETPDGNKVTSDAGYALLRVERGGYSRIALRLPPSAFQQTLPKTININCYNAKAEAAEPSLCQKVNLLKIIRLGADYQLQEIKLKAAPQNIKAGETAAFSIP